MHAHYLDTNRSNGESLDVQIERLENQTNCLDTWMEEETF